jgi:hypothetical protein
MTLSITTVSTVTLSMKDLYVTLTYFTTVVSYTRKIDTSYPALNYPFLFIFITISPFRDTLGMTSHNLFRYQTLMSYL